MTRRRSAGLAALLVLLAACGSAPHQARPAGPTTTASTTSTIPTSTSLPYAPTEESTTAPVDEPTTVTVPSGDLFLPGGPCPVKDVGTSTVGAQGRITCQPGPQGDHWVRS